MTEESIDIRMQRANLIGNCLQCAAGDLFCRGVEGHDLAGQPIYNHEDDPKYLGRVVKHQDGKISVTFSFHPECLPERTRKSEIMERVDEFPTVFLAMVQRWASQQRPEQIPERISVSEDGKTITISDTGSAWDFAGAVSIGYAAGKARGAGVSTQSWEKDNFANMESTYYMPGAVDALDKMPQTRTFYPTIIDKAGAHRGYNPASITKITTSLNNIRGLSERILPPVDYNDSYNRKRALLPLLPPQEEMEQVGQSHVQAFSPKWKEYLKEAIGSRLTRAIENGVDKHVLVQKIAEHMFDGNVTLAFEDGVAPVSVVNFMQILMDDKVNKTASSCLPVIESVGIAGRLEAKDIVSYVAELCDAKLSEVTPESIYTAYQSGRRK